MLAAERYITMMISKNSILNKRTETTKAHQFGMTWTATLTVNELIFMVFLSSTVINKCIIMRNYSSSSGLI